MEGEYFGGFLQSAHRCRPGRRFNNGHFSKGLPLSQGVQNYLIGAVQVFNHFHGAFAYNVESVSQSAFGNDDIAGGIVEGTKVCGEITQSLLAQSAKNRGNFYLLDCFDNNRLRVNPLFSKKKLWGGSIVIFKRSQLVLPAKRLAPQEGLIRVCS